MFSHGKAFISVVVKVWKAAILLLNECTTDLMSTNDQFFPSKGFQCRVIYSEIPHPQSWNAQAWVCFPELNCFTKCQQIYNRKIKHKLKASVYGVSLSEMNKTFIFVILIRHVQNKYSNSWHLNAIKPYKFNCNATH